MHFIFSTRYGASCMSESEWKITQNTHTHTSAQTRTCIDIHHGKRRILHCRTEKIFHFWGKIFCYPSSCCSYACMLFNALASQDDISIHRKKTGASMHLYWCGSTLLLFILRVKQWTTEMKREREKRERYDKINGMLCVYSPSLSPFTSALHTQYIAHYELIYRYSDSCHAFFLSFSLLNAS